MEFSKVFTVKKEVNEQQFLRNVLIGLSKDEKSPANILDAKFGKVTEFEKEFLVLSADVEVNYSGSCGYDREEEYKTTERKSLSQGDWYTIDGIQKRASQSGYYTVDVTKKKTVTDWRPHNGTIKTQQYDYALNEKNGDERLASLFAAAHDSTKEASFVESGTANINSSAYQSLVEKCEDCACRAVEWPGDRVKDKSYHCATDVKSLECYIVPCYMLEFEYNGKKYCARGLAIGNVNEVHEAPDVDGNVESIEIIEERRKQNVNVAEKPLKIKNLFVASAIITGIIALMGLMQIADSPNWAIPCLILGIIFAAGSGVGAVLVNNKVKQAVAEINAKANIEKKELNNIKVDNLVKMLKKLNLPVLSQSEKTELDK